MAEVPKQLTPFKKGESGNPDGRPVGSISALSRLKKEFREHPEKFDEYMERYISNPANEKHVMEMLDGKPMQNANVDLGVTFKLDEETKQKVNQAVKGIL